MSDDEDKLRLLKTQAAQRRRDYESAVAKAYALRESLTEDLAKLKEFGCESLAEAEQLIFEKETEIAQSLNELEAMLA